MLYGSGWLVFDQTELALLNTNTEVVISYPWFSEAKRCLTLTAWHPQPHEMSFPPTPHFPQCTVPADSNTAFACF